MTDLSMMGGDTDHHDLAHPQPLFRALREAGPAIDVGEYGMGVVVVGADEHVRHVLQHPEIFSSGDRRGRHRSGPAAHPAPDRPAHHKPYRKLLDPIFAPKQVAMLEDHTRDPGARAGRAAGPPRAAATSTSVDRAAPHHRLPPAARPAGVAGQGVHRPEGRDHPPAGEHPRGALAYTTDVGQQIYAALQEAIDQRQQEPSGRLPLDVPRRRGRRAPPHRGRRPGHRLPVLPRRPRHGHRVARLHGLVPRASTPSQRQRIVDEPALIPHAIEEMLRWETPGPGRHPGDHRGHRDRRLPDRQGPVGRGHARLGQHRRGAPGPTSTPSTSTGPATATSPSAAAPTAASARTSLAWSCGSAWRSGTPGSPTTGCPRGTGPTTPRASARSTTSPSSGTSDRPDR